MSEKAAIEAFWRWWPEVAGAFDAVFRGDAEMTDALIEALSERVRAIDEALDWEFGPGREEAEHHLCLSAKGDPAKRVITERWLRGAPSPDGVWEFHPARQPMPGPVAEVSMELGGLPYRFGDFELAIAPHEGRPVIDVAVFHPHFAEVDEDVRTTVMFIMLDNVLGEDELERWVGVVESLTEAPVEPRSLEDLERAIAELRARRSDGGFALLRGTVDGHPLVVLVDRGIKRIDHLLLDQHVEIGIPLMHPDEHGMVEGPEAETLDKIEDQLLEMLGEHAVYVGRETSTGERRIHLHVMSEGPAAGIIDRWCKTFDAYPTRVTVTPDPRWDVLDRWG